MAQMNVSVPDALKAWAEVRVAEGRYSSTSDYIRDLMRRDQECALRNRAAVAEGRASPATGVGFEEMFAKSSTSD